MTSIDPSASEQAELERLRRRVAELESDPATGSGAAPGAVAPIGGRSQRWRTVVSTVTIALACLLAPLSVVAVWADRTVNSSDRYVETVAPLVDDPAVQDALADAITAEIFTSIDVEALTQETLDALAAQGLAPRLTTQLQALAGPIANGVEGFTRTQVGKIVSSDAFAAAWEQANRVAHEQLVAALTGKGDGSVSLEDGTVSVNLGDLVTIAKQRLTARGFGLAERIPVVDREFVIFQSDDLAKAQSGVRLLGVLGVWLTPVALVLIAVGVYAAKSRRRALIGAGLGVAASMLLLGVLLTVFRQVYLDAVPSDALPPDAASTLFDTLIRFMRSSLRSTFIVGAVVAAGAFLTGPSRTAVGVRRVFGNGIGAIRRATESAGLSTGRVGGWVYAYRGPLRVAVVVLAAVTVIAWDQPTVATVLVITVVTLVVLAVVEFLARPPGEDTTEDVPAVTESAAGTA